MKEKIIFTPNDTKLPEYLENLNSEQEQAFMQIRNFLYKEANDYSMFCLKGFAGTGKTFLISRVVKYCLDNHKHFRRKYSPIKIAMTAPTNKAVQVLRESSNLPDVEYLTCHKLLGLKEVILPSGEIVFKNEFEDKFTNIKECDILIIDEVSMLNDDLFFEIKRYSNQCRIIFMGDPAQIPPVGKPDCEPFLNPEKHDIKSFEISQIMRQKEGSEIIDLSFNIRNGNYSFNHKEGYDLFIKHSSQHKEEIKKMFFDTYQSSEALEKNFVKTLCWTNRQVQQYNIWLRKIFLKHHFNVSEPGQICVNDRIVANSPIVEDKELGDILMHTNQEGVVQGFSLSKGIYEDTEFAFYHVVVETEDYKGEPKRVVIKLLHKDNREKLNATLEKIKNSALYAPAHKRKYFWKRYYDLQRIFADIDFSYALTVHKSQGSTYDTVFVDANNILMNENKAEMRRILYTASTRPKNKLIIIN